LAIHYVSHALERWERRISVLSLDAARAAEDPSLLEVRLKYRVRTLQHDDEIAVIVPVDTRGPL
jgi:phage baseplate assembly protein W